MLSLSDSQILSSMDSITFEKYVLYTNDFFLLRKKYTHFFKGTKEWFDYSDKKREQGL